MKLQWIATRQCPLLSILRGELRLSSTLRKHLKGSNAILLNGEPAFTNAPVYMGDCITVTLPYTLPQFPSQPMELSVLYEDDCLIAVDKPSGCIVHPTANRLEGTLANGLLHYYIEQGQECAIHPVIRLDRDTLGVVLFAKNAHIHALCSQDMQAGQYEKTYLAGVFGVPPHHSAIIHAPIGKMENSLWRHITPDGQMAKSKYTLLHQEGHCCLLRLCPLTGRTHQLRLHCQHAGFPILGDPIYNSPQSEKYSHTLHLTHQQLLAAQLTFPHPMTGKIIEIHSNQQVIFQNLGKFP